MIKPNTFIIGAPKCGTTALCQYLSDHPSVFMSTPKEPHYFAKEDMPNRPQYYKNLDNYLSLFSTAQSKHEIIMEGSVWYLYCENSAKALATFNPNAKLIVMVRRPDEMVYSLHSQALASYDEDITDFEKAWSMALNPNERKRIPKLCFEPKVLMYDKIALYGEQLERLYRYFPKHQVHVIFYEDFTNDTLKSYNKTLEFLEIEQIELRPFTRVNENSVVKNRFLGKYFAHPPQPLVKLLSFFKSITGIEKFGIVEKLQKLNSKTEKRKPIEIKVKRDVIANYHDDIKKLEKITGRDLEHWLD